MYINIKEAEAAGLRIRIRTILDQDGEKYLEITPQDGLKLESLDNLQQEMKDKLDLTSNERGDIMDRVSADIHQATIWTGLKHLDRSER